MLTHPTSRSRLNACFRPLSTLTFEGARRHLVLGYMCLTPAPTRPQPSLISFQFRLAYSGGGILSTRISHTHAIHCLVPCFFSQSGICDLFVVFLV